MFGVGVEQAALDLHQNGESGVARAPVRSHHLWVELQLAEEGRAELSHLSDDGRAVGVGLGVLNFKVQDGVLVGRALGSSDVGMPQG